MWKLNDSILLRGEEEVGMGMVIIILRGGREGIVIIILRGGPFGDQEDVVVPGTLPVGREGNVIISSEFVGHN